jgi:hypothetical protein
MLLHTKKKYFLSLFFVFSKKEKKERKLSFCLFEVCLDGFPFWKIEGREKNPNNIY